MTDTVVLQHSTDDATEQKQRNLSREEIEEIFIRQYLGLVRYARKWSRDDDEDIVQEVFLKLLTNQVDHTTSPRSAHLVVSA